MDWFPIVGAFGFGAVASKLIDVLLLERITRRRDHEAWLRDRRLEAYEKVAADVLSYGLMRQDHTNPFEAYAKLSRAFLLANSDNLASEIDSLLVNIDKLIHLAPGDSTADELYRRLNANSRELVKKLRVSVVGT